MCLLMYQLMVHDAGKSESQSVLYLIFGILLTAHQISGNIRIVIYNIVGIGYCCCLLIRLILSLLNTGETFLGKENLSNLSLLVLHAVQLHKVGNHMKILKVDNGRINGIVNLSGLIIVPEGRGGNRIWIGVQCQTEVHMSLQIVKMMEGQYHILSLIFAYRSRLREHVPVVI